MPSSPKEQVDYGAPFTSSGVCGGLDLGPPVGVAGCATCGERTKVDGHWVNKLTKEREPVCGKPECLCDECGNALGESYLVTSRRTLVCGRKKCRLAVAKREAIA